MAGWLDKQKTVAGEKFNRWLVPPAALAIHLCIGMAYGFSVFWLPMTRLKAGTPPECAQRSLIAHLFTHQCNWTVPEVSFTWFILILGVAAAFWGGWLEHAGPRKSGFIAAICWGGGMALGGVGVLVHQLWLVWLGCGIIGGIGQGLGYITPVSTLIVMGLIYLVAMSAGAFGFRTPPTGWLPTGWSPSEAQVKAMITDRHVHLAKAWRTPQFWLIWGVLCLNVSAGIGVIGMASPMLQDIFGPLLVGASSHAAVTTAQRAAIVAAAAGLVGLISLFNSLGRLFWASVSDWIGRSAAARRFSARRAP